MKAAATPRQREGSDCGGVDRSAQKDNANDTAISPFNTCLASTLPMRVAAEIKVELDFKHHENIFSKPASYWECWDPGGTHISRVLTVK